MAIMRAKDPVCLGIKCPVSNGVLVFVAHIGAVPKFLTASRRRKRGCSLPPSILDNDVSNIIKATEEVFKGLKSGRRS